MFVSIIIPAYNEEKRIGKTLDTLLPYLFKESIRTEVLVVDDGSTDKTDEVVKKFTGEFPSLRLLRLAKNSGKGAAVRHGMREAKGDVKIFMDADGSTEITALPKVLEKINGGAEVVVTSRRMQGARVLAKENLLHDFLGTLFRTLVRLIVPLGVSDSQNGFKAFTKLASERIFSRQTIMDFSFDVEVLAIARVKNLRIAQVPVDWTDDRRSTVTVPAMFRMLFSLFRIRKNLWSHAYDK